MSNVSRRTFLGTAGVAVGAGAASGASEKPSRSRKSGGRVAPKSLESDIFDLVSKTPFVDTHEHLWEESYRVRSKAEKTDVPAPDFGLLMMHYTDSDLQVSGMSSEDFRKLVSRDIAPRDKWRLVAPYYARCRNTGYQQCIRAAVRILYGEDDLREDNCEAVSRKIADGIQPGFYRRILKEAANVEYCQNNSLDAPVFRETAQPDLLAQDISTVALSIGLAVDAVAKLVNRDVSSLRDWRDVIDVCFANYGPRAIAVKNQCAYGRRLDFADVGEDAAAPLFETLLKDPKSLTPQEHKAIEDHCFHYTVEKATEYGLPVKLHTGYHAGRDGMPLERVRQNAGDLCPLFRAHDGAKFVLMHIDYPYQDEVIALAKHYSNVYVDLCWAWIINPLASVRFVKEFLMAAPACKLLTFGGDYLPVEAVPGHAYVARKGLAQAIAELVKEEWVEEEEVPALIDRVMRGNAHELFDYDRALKNWGKKT